MSQSNYKSQAGEPNVQDYYVDEDFNDVLSKLLDIIKEAKRKTIEVLEPTIYEKIEVSNIVNDFIRKKKRIVYGGTTINETIKAKDQKNAIYDDNDDYTFSDVEKLNNHPAIEWKPCRQCNNKLYFCYQLQTRSADEPMTTFYICKDCNKTYKVNN